MNIKKNIIWNVLGTTINAFVSFFLLIIVTRINGADDAGIFSFAFSVSLIFNVIGVYYGRVYQTSDKSNISDLDYIVSKILMCLIMMIVSLLFVLVNRYDFYKSSIIMVLCFLKCIEAFMESIYAILQKNDELYKVGISFSIKGILSVVIFVLIDLFTKNIILSSFAVVVVHILICITYDLFNVKNIKISKNISKSNIRYLITDGFYPFLITFLCLYIINSSKYAIDLTLDNVSQTIFGIIIMPATVILMFVQYILHPYIVDITKNYNSNKYSNIKQIIHKFYIAIASIGLLGVIIAATIGIPVLQLIYGLDLTGYRMHLVLIMIGASLYGVVSVLFNILIIMRKNKIQSMILVFVSIITFVLSYILAKYLGLLGATLSYVITMFILFVIYITIIYFVLRKGDLNEKC